MGLRRDEATLRHVIAASITGAPIERTDYMDALHTTHNLAMTRGQHGFLLDLIRTTLRSQFVDANFRRRSTYSIQNANYFAISATFLHSQHPVLRKRWTAC
jgi:hypothetical protein